jgi:two-component system, OmpR family, sensor kinase
MKKINLFIRVKSLKGQLIMRIFLVLFCLLILIEIAQYVVIQHYLMSSKKELLESRLHNIEIERFMETSNQELLVEQATEYIHKMIDLNVSVTVINHTGEVIASVDQDQLEEYERHLLKRDQNQLDRNIKIPYLIQNEYLAEINADNIISFKKVMNTTNEPFMILITKVGPLDKPVGLIQLSTSLKPVSETMRRLLQIFGLISMTSLIAGLFILSQVIVVTLRPLDEMKHTIDTLTIQDLEQRLNENQGQVEIDQLAKAYNNMLIRIDQSFSHEIQLKEKMRQFISDASHELRTPLTSIHGFAEILLMGAAKDEIQMELALNTILNESDRLTNLVNDLLTLNKIDQSSSVQMQQENLNDILMAIKPQIDLMAQERKIIFDYSQQEAVIVCNKNQIIQVIINLVNNAIKFTDHHEGVIQIQTSSDVETKNVTLKIIDNGIGMSPEVQSKIFDRFYREQTHRSRDTGGYGLGLAIAKAIVNSHKGEIFVESQIGKGSIFTLEFETT